MLRRAGGAGAAHPRLGWRAGAGVAAAAGGGCGAAAAARLRDRVAERRLPERGCAAERRCAAGRGHAACA